MEDYQVIEPSRIDHLKMTEPSSIYETYHHLLQHSSRETAAERTKDYCLKEDLNKEEQIIALEFLYMNGYFEGVKAILAKRKIEDIPAFLYRLLYKRKQGKEISPQELQKLNSLETEEPMLRTLQLFLYVYYHYDSKQFGSLDKYIDDIYEMMHQIDKPLVKYYFQLRFDELMFLHHWKSNMELVAKKYAYRVINSTLSSEKQCGMYHHLALCDVYDNYTSAMAHLQTAIRIAEENDLKESIYELREKSLPFIAAFHRKTEGVTTSDLVETAHLAIANNQMKKAEEILRTLDTLTPFQETYLGVASNNGWMLQKAYRRFKNEYGDHFFARLPFYYMKYLR